MPKAGGATTIISGVEIGPRAVVVDGTHVFWVNFANSEVRRAPKTGGPAITIANSSSPHMIAVDLTRVYWTEAFFGGNLVGTCK